MQTTKQYNWDGQDGYRYFLGKLDAESFGEKVGYELIRIQRSSNLQRGTADLDTRFGRTVQDENGILDDAIAAAPANIKRILNRFATKTKTKTMKLQTTTTKPTSDTRPEEVTMKQVRDLIHAEALKCAEKWFPLQCRKDWASFYLYYRTGELDVDDGEDAPAGWTLASAERLNPGDTRAQVAAKIATIAQRLPFLPV